MLTVKLNQTYKRKTHSVTVNYKPRKHTLEPHQLIIGGCINLSLKTSLSISRSVKLNKPKKTYLQLNREVEHHHVYFSKQTKSWSFWYILPSGQFLTEHGYSSRASAMRALSRMVNSIKKEIQNDQDSYLYEKIYY